MSLQMIWNDVLNIIKKGFSYSDKKEWLDKLVQNLEFQRDENNILPFQIIEIKERGFVVKVSGLYAFIFYKRMPWRYPDSEVWKVISPYLIGKEFFCKVYEINKDPLSIIVNGDVAPLKKTELIIGEKYVGIVIHKTKYGVFLDLGYYFDWKCGSLIGLLHKTQFDSSLLFDNCEVGGEFVTFYQGVNENGQLVLGDKLEILDWNLRKPQELVGQVIWVRVRKYPDNRQTEYLVKGKYPGIMPISSQFYQHGYISKIKRAKSALADEEIISCEVMGYNSNKRVLHLKWIMEFDPDSLSEVSISNLIDNDTIKKLKSLSARID